MWLGDLASDSRKSLRVWKIISLGGVGVLWSPRLGMDLTILDDPFGGPSVPWGPMELPSYFLFCTLSCVLKTLAQKSWRSSLSSLIDLEYFARALEMIKRERGKNKQNQNRKRNLFHQVAQPAADLRPLSFPEPMRCNLFPVMLNKIANSCGNIW